MILNAVGNGLQAALLLAQGRAEGMRLVETSRDGAVRSFLAVAICLPAFLFLRLLDWVVGEAPPHMGHALAADLLGYVIGWMGFALLSRELAGLLGRAERWPGFIAAWNWCNVAQYGLLVLAGLPELFGAPGWLQQTAALVALGWALWLEWYATRLALDISVIAAIGLVLADVVIGLLIVAVTAGAATL